MTESHISTLDLRYGVHGWEIWRTQDGGWVVRIHSKHTNIPHFNANRPTLTEALQVASEHKLLPVVTRRPVELARSGFTSRRIRNKWVLSYMDDDLLFNLANQTEVTKCIDRAINNRVVEISEWNRRFSAIVASGVEGVDYRIGE